MPRDDDTTVPALKRALAFTLELSVDEIPPATLRQAAICMLDTLGVCIAAHPMEAGRLGRDAAVRLYGANDHRDQAPLLLDGRRVSRAGAAFAAATQIDNLDAHDGYNPTKGHIGVAAVPALLAIAHGNNDLTGRDALAALVVGYEIAGRAGLSLHASVTDYHTSGAWNALGVAALTARVAGLSPIALRHAWGIAEYHGPRSQMMREIANPTMLHDGSGMGALVGVSAAIMASMGFTGAPAITIEAPEAAPFWQDLGRVWQTDLQYIKPYPICRWAHAAIDAVRQLKSTNGFSAEMIEAIEVSTFNNAARLYRDVPETTSQAQYSMAFAVSTMAAYGEIRLEHISGNGLNDPLVAALIKRTRVIADQRHEDRFPEGRWSDVTINLKDGVTLHSGDVHARGGPEHPTPETEIIEKYMGLASPIIGAYRAEAIRDATLALEEPEVRLADLQALLTAPPAE